PRAGPPRRRRPRRLVEGGDRRPAAAGRQRHPPRPARGDQAPALPPAAREHRLRPRAPAGGARLRAALRPRHRGRPRPRRPLRRHVRQRVDAGLRRRRPRRRPASPRPRARGGAAAGTGRSRVRRLLNQPTDARRLAWVVTAVFVVLTVPRLLLHEVWRDEAWLWLVAGEAHSPLALFRLLARTGQG